MIGGFRLERPLGHGSRGSVHEATQLSLGRRVALRLLDRNGFPDPAFLERVRDEQRRAAALHHPSLIPPYEVGEWAGGTFIAMRYVRGQTLAVALEERSLSRPQLEAALASVTGAVDVLHGAGLAHGAIAAHNVLVDAGGTAYLADVGLARGGSAEADRRGLALLVSQVERGGARRRRSPVALALVAGGLAVAATAVAMLAGGGDGDDADARPAPPVAPRAAPLGSDLRPGPAQSLGCSRDPGPNTEACTLSPSRVGGRPVTFARRGVIRSWAVRGAEGELALQVIGRRDGQEYVRGFSRLERVPDTLPHVFEADLTVEPGDRLGVLLAPGATIGARATGGASALRWEGTLDFRPRPHGSRRVERELLLRADVRYGAGAPRPRQLTGQGAAQAEAGQALGDAVVEDLPGDAVRVELVRTPTGIAIDSVRGRRRLARIEVADADPGGRVSRFDSQCGYPRGVCLRWLNAPDAAPLVHVYRLVQGGRGFRQLG